MTDLEYPDFLAERKAFQTVSNLNHDSVAEQADGHDNGKDFPEQNKEKDLVDSYPADLLLPFLLPSKLESYPDLVLRVVGILKLLYSPSSQFLQVCGLKGLADAFREA